MKPKQEEMDAVIEKIYRRIIEFDKTENQSTVFVLCSDHGMNEVTKIKLVLSRLQ